ncbi:PIR protein CIR protein [Plasmodium vinckei lentum]|uniref:PIR protein CIR protein n=1 Tax=Plasmodium vinckei lentum TaxID=138297 RepID=A0A6V7SA47_PLAVN|nr:PIR protein CIR protein [Plasmodium vinckei lentum]
MVERACKYLRDADDFFTNEIVNEEKFNKDSLFRFRCPYDKINRNFLTCKNNYERINALGGYLYQNLNDIAHHFKGKGNDANRHIEIFIMWLCDKLYNLEEKKTATLEEYYNNHLKASMGYVDYWDLLDSKKVYKKANVWYMSELYKLLNCICNIVIEYNKKNKNTKKIEKYSSQCYDKFKSVYNNVKDCYSYFHLLKYLKGIYDNIRNDAIKKDDELKAVIRKYATRRNAIISEIIKKFNIPPQIKGSKKILEYVLKASSISLIDLTTSDWDQRFPNASDQTLDFNTQKCVELNTETTKKQQELESKKKLTAQSQPEPQAASQKSGESPQSGTNDSGTQKGNSDSEDGGKGGTKGESGSTGSGHGVVAGGPDKGAPSLQDDLGGSPGGSGSPVPLTGDTNNTSGSQGDSSNQGGSDDGSKPLGNQVPTHPSGEPNGYFPSNWGMNFNLMSHIPSASDIYETPKNILANTANKITNAYSNTVGNIKYVYDNTVDNIKYVYDNTVDNAKKAYKNTMNNITNIYNRTSDYIGGVVNSVVIQLNPLNTSQLGDNQPASNSLGGGSDTSDQPQPKSPAPLQSLLPPPSPSPPSTPQSTSQLSQTPSDSPLPKSIDSQTISTPIHNCPVQQTSPTGGSRVSQIPPSGQGTLTISGSNSSNTKNENLTTVASVKMKETSSIWCIGSNNKCGIMGISIIVISISIILTIIYKYLSLGFTSKSKRKKSVKKVINSIGGKRPIQIIIKSYDRNKDLKPVINSVGRKKDPLLNIYKLMQADPVPFINVFFLLIFFVYKRQLNYLKL